jgi:hypothetical protein
MKLSMFRTVPLSIIGSLFTVHSAMVYVIQVCKQLSSRTRMELQFHPGPACKLCLQCLMTYTMLRVQWINSWWWTDERSETCRVSWQNKFVKLVHVVGFIIKKFVTMHGHTNVKKTESDVSQNGFNPFPQAVLTDLLLVYKNAFHGLC